MVFCARHSKERKHGMSRVITKLTGTRPLLLHNVQLADPDNRWAREIAQITKKRKKTEEDRKAIADLEWEGGLYIHNGVISMPTANVLRAFVETAKISKQGKTITRALTPTELSVPSDLFRSARSGRPQEQAGIPRPSNGARRHTESPANPADF
jgi:hypothetical protein